MQLEEPKLLSFSSRVRLVAKELLATSLLQSSTQSLLHLLPEWFGYSTGQQPLARNYKSRLQAPMFLFKTKYLQAALQADKKTALVEHWTSASTWPLRNLKLFLIFQNLILSIFKFKGKSIPQGQTLPNNTQPIKATRALSFFTDANSTL